MRLEMNHLSVLLFIQHDKRIYIKFTNLRKKAASYKLQASGLYV